MSEFRTKCIQTLLTIQCEYQSYKYMHQTVNTDILSTCAHPAHQTIWDATHQDLGRLRPRCGDWSWC